MDRRLRFQREAKAVITSYSEVCKNMQKEAELSKSPLASPCLLSHPFYFNHADILQLGTST